MFSTLNSIVKPSNQKIDRVNSGINLLHTFSTTTLPDPQTSNASQIGIKRNVESSGNDTNTGITNHMSV
jgi:hypothetical protein